MQLSQSIIVICTRNRLSHWLQILWLYGHGSGILITRNVISSQKCLFDKSEGKHPVSSIMVGSLIGFLSYSIRICWTKIFYNTDMNMIKVFFCRWRRLEMEIDSDCTLQGKMNLFNIWWWMEKYKFLFFRMFKRNNKEHQNVCLHSVILYI